MKKGSRTWAEFVSTRLRWDPSTFRERFLNEKPKPYENMNAFVARLAKDAGTSYGTADQAIREFGLRKERMRIQAEFEALKVKAYQAARANRQETIEKDDPTAADMECALTECLSELRVKIKDAPKEAEALARTFQILLKTREDYVKTRTEPSGDRQPTESELFEQKRLDELEAKLDAEEPYVVPAAPGAYARDMKKEQAFRDKQQADQELLDKIEAHSKILAGAQPGEGG